MKENKISLRKDIKTNQQGVTLIALVVTIIVLIILAGVSIAILTGDNGIINNAKEAQKSQIEGEVKDKVNLAVASAKMIAEQQSVKNAGFLAETNLKTYNDATETTAGTYATGDLIYKELKTSLGDGYSVHVENEGKRVIIHYETSAYKSAINDDKAGITVPVTVSGNSFTIGTYVYNNKDNEFTGTVQESAGGGTTPTTPTATTYTVSYDANGGTGSIADATGASITLSDGTGLIAPEGKVFKNWNTSADGSGTTYAIGQTVTANLELYAIWAKKDTNNVLEGESGYLGSNYKDPYVPVGFTHTTGTWNSGYTIKGNTGTTNADDEFVWVPCTTTATTETVAFAKITTAGTKYNQSNLTDITDVSGAKADLIKTSVGNHGGFYIAKYEASSSNGTDSGTARSVSGATPWVTINRTNSIAKAEAMVNTTDNVKSALISGECWDTTLQWMVTKSDNVTANTTPKSYDINSTGKGYYEQSDLTTTGYYAVNGIYDMAGNVYEWTTENCKNNGNDKLVQRGRFLQQLGFRQSSSRPWLRHCQSELRRRISCRAL